MKQILILVFLSCIIYKNFYGQNWDIDILREINLNRNTALDPTFKIVTNSVSPISIATPLITLSSGYLTHNNTLKGKGVYMAETVLVSAFVTTSLKYSIRRDRPFETYPDIQNLTSAGSPSFPSGHTSEAFATATSLSMAFPKWYVIAPAYVWASAAAYSRMHLGVHYPTDVLVGAAVGAGSAWLCKVLNEKLIN